MQDKLMPIAVVEDPEELHQLLVEVLGFEEGLRQDSDQGSLSVYSYGSSNVGVATPGALPDLPAQTGPAVFVLEVPDVEATRNVLQARGQGAVGPLREGYFGAFFDVTDSRQHIFRFLQKSDVVAYQAP